MTSGRFDLGKTFPTSQAKNLPRVLDGYCMQPDVPPGTALYPIRSYDVAPWLLADHRGGIGRAAIHRAFRGVDFVDVFLY